MPFKTRRQLATCFSKELTAAAAAKKKKKWSWDCERWLSETNAPPPRCLPELVGHAPKIKSCRPMRQGEHVIGALQTGPRGGKFFFIDDVKIYVPRGAESIAQKRFSTERRV